MATDDDVPLTQDLVEAAELVITTTQSPQVLVVTHPDTLDKENAPKRKQQRKKQNNRNRRNKNKNVKNDEPSPGGVRGLIQTVLGAAGGVNQPSGQGNDNGVNQLIASAIQNSDSIPQGTKNNGDQTLGGLAQTIIAAQEAANPNATKQQSKSENQQSTPSPEELQEIIQTAIAQSEAERAKKEAQKEAERDPNEPTVEDVQKLIGATLGSNQNTQGGRRRQNKAASANLASSDPRTSNGNQVGQLIETALSGRLEKDDAAVQERNEPRVANLVVLDPETANENQVGQLIETALVPTNDAKIENSNRRNKRLRNKQGQRKGLGSGNTDVDSPIGELVGSALTDGSLPSSNSGSALTAQRNGGLRRRGRGGGNPSKLRGRQNLQANKANASRLNAGQSNSLKSNAELEAEARDRKALKAERRRKRRERKAARQGKAV